MTKTKEDILRMIDEAGVRYIRLCFTDILGKIKGMSITRSEIEQVLEEGQGFDGSSVEGFARIEESDLMAIPDPLTFRIIPWDIAGEKIAILFCDIQNPDGTPYAGDPRWILKKNLQKVQDKGWTFYVGPEIEYFYFNSSEGPEVIDQAGYFDYESVDIGTMVRKRTVRALEEMNIAVECSHHEVAPSQHEIDLKYQDALVMADFAQIYKFVVKEVAMESDLYATFMPKPIYGQNGSGMHCHQSLFKGDKNLFFDPKGEYNLSKTAQQYVAGILTHIKEITLVTNQWVNSYKRLVPGYEAPVYIGWGNRNRSSMVRVPMYRVGKEKATRVELRSPDPAANPYLAFACMLAAGMKGIEGNYKLPDPIEENIFHMDDDTKKKLNIETLPDSLENAINAFEQSDLARETLGDHIFTKLIENKRLEWDQYRVHVGTYETGKYLPLL
ncbi:MAG TPA: glutamine synthetase family protein [candidate division Zixibacteria bacterium]|nr:glutamine synthetase family protein [candidate division Zixibacteria bacterium]